ncbi:MAG: hypothetical protein CMJ35_01705 [Phycisphaerae bacterium]|nr:hypothetical protein [Phycisphaerae bacterium]MBM90313.1 hypothetical protein [Phycisphaerae bacterium]HCT46083.1 hypothetical protein [Phycisphaerales bacterium]|tara:strand:- start:88 stop:1089 length:1002 start_codon:yes stop_codon:yes gene_type:complete
MSSFADKSAPLQSLSPIAPIGRISIGSVFSSAHAVLAERWGTLVGCAALIIIYGFIVGIVITLLDNMIFGIDAMVRPFEMLHSILITGPLSVGPIYIACRTFRGQHSIFADILIGFRRWPSVVLIGLIIQLGALLATIPFGVLTVMLSRTTAGNSGFTILMLFVLVFGLAGIALYLGVRLYFATLLCADPLGPQLGPIESISESWRITRNSAWRLFFIAILISIIVGITTVCFIVPLVLYGLPLSYAAAGSVYVILTHRSGIIPVEGYDECPFCDYDLVDLDTNRCPECGAHVIRPQTPQYGQIHEPMPHEQVADDLPDIPLVDVDEEDSDAP